MPVLMEGAGRGGSVINGSRNGGGSDGGNGGVGGGGGVVVSWDPIVLYGGAELKSCKV